MEQALSSSAFYRHRHPTSNKQQATTFSSISGLRNTQLFCRDGRARWFRAPVPRCAPGLDWTGLDRLVRLLVGTRGGLLVKGSHARDNLLALRSQLLWYWHYYKISL